MWEEKDYWFGNYIDSGATNLHKITVHWKSYVDIVLQMNTFTWILRKNNKIATAHVTNFVVSKKWYPFHLYITNDEFDSIWN